MTIPMLSKDITMSIHTDSSASKAVASRLGLNRKTKHVQLKYLYMQDILQRGEMTITKVQTTLNPAHVLTKHLPSATISSHLERVCLQTDSQPHYVNNLRGLPTSTTRTIGMIGLQQPIDTDGQPTVAETTTTSATSRSRAM
eukprot:5553762-Amphidinium_carterae.1